MMQKPLTRRAREYFEVFDALRAEGYLSYEEWQYIEPNDQKNHLRMTNVIIEDALLERCYSKGSASE